MPNNTRKTVIAGNWKMNKTPAEAAALIKEIRAEIDGKNTAGCDVVACVPYVDLAVVLEACKGSVIKVGAENVHWEKSGAYTGEISADILKEIGVEYVIVGHSERRQYFGETDETVNLRVKAALAAGLKVILCVGELLAQREQGITDEVVSLQTKVALQGVGAEALKNVIIAYEPVWAIGTGRTATSEQADEVCGVIRGVIAGLYSDAEDLAVLCQAMLNGGIYKGVRLYKKEVIDEFTSEQNGKPSRGLGFERGSSFMGRGDRHYDAFGHAGFTGTHVVMNKTNKTAVVFLTNKQNVGFKPDSTSYYSPYSCCGEICELVWNIFGTEAPAETLADKIGTWL